MKPIKFRAWNKESNTMVDLEKITPLALNDMMNDQMAVRGMKGIFIPFDKDIILMQYTGLEDKNSKEIYAEDIVRNGKGDIYKVSWYNYGFHLDSPKKDGEWASYTLEAYEYLHHSGPSISLGQPRPKHYDDYDLEIIGNMYESPEVFK